ncbi:piggyBac transposable element-derived protein 4-like [Rhopilema esculentum]|uniref:piggyBac transposable element-derived protein 4-like n=1 Tax=Rhopilema esculentum TaxID=499914 RepID=UPI0031DAA98D
MATNDCSALSDSDSESSDSSAADIGDFSSEFIDEFYNVFGDSDDEEEEFEGFRFEMPEVKWALGGNVRRQSADAETVDERPKPAEVANLSLDAKPIEYLQLFLSDELLQRVVDWTIMNAEKKLGATEGERWTTTLDEVKAYLGVVLIANSLLTTPRNERYFIADENKWIFHTNICKVFSKNRFREIQRFIHFCDPNIPATNDRLYKVRPVIDHLQKKFREMYVLGREMSVDESMIPFKGHIAWTQRMPQKPVKVGIKVFVVADSQTGYCWNFQIYTGKVTDQEDDVGDLGKTDRVVIDLVKNLTHQGHHLYLDNFYTSVPLVLFLKSQGIYTCGTMRSNRRYFPIDILSRNAKSMARGEFNFAFFKGLTALMWKDSKPVYFLSSIHDATLGKPVTRNLKKNGKYEKVQIACPILVSDYNTNMAGVDKSDQQSVVKKDKKQKTYYMRIFISFFMKCINNSYIIEGHVKPHVVQGKAKRDLLSFKEELAIQLVGNVRAKGKGRKRKRTEEDKRLQNVGAHLPKKGQGKDHRCLVCKRKRQNWIKQNPDADPKNCPFSLSKTTFCCAGCEPQDTVYLCITKENNCFINYHTKVQFWL